MAKAKISFPSPFEDTELFKKISIRQTRKNRWRLSFRHAGKRYFIQKSPDGKPFVTYEDAWLAKNMLALDLKNDTFNPEEWSGKSPWQFGNGIIKWVKGNVSESEYKQSKKRIADKFLIPFFQKRDFRTITDSDISNFYRHLKTLTYADRRKNSKVPPKPYSDKRIKDILAELRGFLLSQKEHFKKFPTFPKVRVQLPDIKWLDAEQQDKVFEFFARENLPIFTFMRFTGCRPSEASGLLRQNVDKVKRQFTIATVLMKGGKIRETTKTRISRPLPIVPEIKACFSYETESKFVFTSKGRPYSRKMLGERW